MMHVGHWLTFLVYWKYSFLCGLRAVLCAIVLLRFKPPLYTVWHKKYAKGTWEIFLIPPVAASLYLSARRFQNGCPTNVIKSSKRRYAADMFCGSSIVKKSVLDVKRAVVWLAGRRVHHVGQDHPDQPASRLSGTIQAVGLLYPFQYLVATVLALQSQYGRSELPAALVMVCIYL